MSVFYRFVFEDRPIGEDADLNVGFFSPVIYPDY